MRQMRLPAAKTESRITPLESAGTLQGKLQIASYLSSDIEGGTVPVSQCVGLSVIVSRSSPPVVS